MSILRVIKKLRQILSRHQKVRVIELGVLMVVAGFLEMLSVSLILPFMEAIIDPENVMANKYVVMICELCGIQSYRTFLVLLALVMAFLYIFKNIFLLFQMMVQNRFIAYNQLYTKRQMLRAYLMRPYEYFLDVKSGDVLQVINGDTSIVYGLLGSLLSFFAESVVSFFLIITILIMSPGITLGVAALMLVMIGIIQTVMRPINSRMGAEMRTVGAGLQQWLIQAVQGIKELKITGSESFFERKFSTYGNKYVQIEYKHMTLILVPRFMIEAVSMSSFFIVIAVMIYRGQPLETLLPILSGVAMAAIRLLPSVNRITGALAGIAYSEAALENMGKRLNEMTVIRSSNLMEESIGAEKLGIISALKDAVQLKGVEYKYPQGHENVLDGADMVIRRGQSVGIVGSSGAGKTTAVDILLGLLEPGKGTVTIDGVDIHSDMGGWLAQIGYIPQSIFILDGTIRDNVAFGKETDKENDDQVWRALREAALEEFVRSLPDGLDTQLGERGVRLSGGQRQRIGIARALYNDPQILFFDEATSALDNETEAAIMESINSLQGEKTMIIIAHRLTTIENCDVVYRVADGKIVRER